MSWSRLGAAHSPGDLVPAPEERRLIELVSTVRPAEDVAGRVHPDELVDPVEEAVRLRDERRLGSPGIARARVTEVRVGPYDIGQAGKPAVVEGVAGGGGWTRACLGQPFEGRTALLPPFDRLNHDRRRAP